MIHSKGLTDVFRAQIRELDAICSGNELLCMKLNWDMLETRPADEVNDLLWYAEGRLVGYIGLYGFGSQPKEIEMTGMVHPDYRHNGIFTKLFNEAVSIARKRCDGRVLLIAERQSLSGAGFAKNSGLTYAFSEYRMICDEHKKQASPDGFSLRLAAAEDIPFLEDLDEVCFGSSFPGRYEEELGHVYLAVQNGSDVGKIGLNYEDGLGYVFGVCVLPEYRGRGCGRAMLDGILKKHFEDRSTSVILEVAVVNDNALTLYKSCGFNELTIYDYYEMKL